MSFGYSVGDFVAVTQLAWTVYKSCRDAPESFNNISTELLSLHAVLKEVEEIISEQPLSETRRQHLATISNGCQCVLQDLQALVKKYESLGSQSKRTWDRMKWGSNDIAELRARLTSNTVLLTAFMSTSQVVVEKKLNKLVQEFQDGQHEGTIKTVATVESLTLDDKQTWRTIRKELEDIGISVAAFDANKGFIMEWFQKAIETGAFEEQTISGTHDSESDSSEVISHLSFQSLQSYSEGNAGLSEVRISFDKSPTITSVPVVHRRTSGETYKAKRAQGRDADPPKPEKKSVKVKRSWLLSAVAFVLRYDESFFLACRGDDYTSAKKFLERGANINTVYHQRDTALGSAASSGNQKMAIWLLSNGADVNSGMIYLVPSSPLHKALKAGHDETAQLLIESGALNTMGEALRGTLSLAAVEGSCQKSLELLLERGDLNLEAKDSQGFTALDHAVQKDDLSMAGSLLSRGAINNKPSLDERLLVGGFHAVKGRLKGTVAIVEGYQRLADLMKEKRAARSIQPIVDPGMTIFDPRQSLSPWL